MSALGLDVLEADRELAERELHHRHPRRDAAQDARKIVAANEKRFEATRRGDLAARGRDYRAGDPVLEALSMG
ncbi:hypothetical protein IVA87_21500 [Bradyrhizobium sp. 147]|uniref:hypothetical protein n=1 Tax=unclassified Bradyrhizobium TaxID=2631580 RepID=UPI001FFB10E2|nr:MULTISPECIES: hypothetical protein [unclassified Bradyrhizobium]MCK1628168.1 hypothetical protein [Bradyrhizobium sp. 160]MCK1681919.1 hypothetical protein [Bradyrhizobium sp. 147]